MKAVICVNRYRKKPSEEASTPEAHAAPSPAAADGAAAQAESPGSEPGDAERAEAPVAGSTVGSAAEAPSADADEAATSLVSEEELSSEEEVLEAVSQEELRGYQEILESSEDEEEEEEEPREEEKEVKAVEVEAIEEPAEETVQDLEVDEEPEAATSPVREVAEVAEASEVSSDSEGNELDLEAYDYEISDDDDEAMEPVDVSDEDDDLDFDDFDGEDDFEDDLNDLEDLEDYEEEDDLGPLKQGFSTWLACWHQELPQRLAKPGAAQSLRERLLEALQKETGSKSTGEVNRFSLQWEHSLVFDDCPPLLGFVSKKDAEALLQCRALVDLQLKFAWSEEVVPPHPVAPEALAEPGAASPPGRPTREIRLDRSRSRDRSPERFTRRPYFESPEFEKKLRSSPRLRLEREPGPLPPWCKDIMSFPEERPKVALEKNGVLVVYKPAFWTMTTCQGNEPVMSRHSALQDWIRRNVGHRYKFLYTNDRAGMIHRLDVQTSGPIVCAVTPRAFKNLRESLHYHKFYKEYIALMHGALPVRQCCGEMDYPLSTTRERGYSGWRTCVDPRGQFALTRYEAVAAYKYSEGHGKTQRYTLVRLHLITGKTHQIRVHLMELARRNNLKTHGIVGDYKYLPPRNLKLDKRICRRVFLHCYRLHFPMPDAEDDNLCKVRCPLPSELQEALKQIDLDKDLTENYRKQCRRHHVMASDDMIDPKKYLNIPGLVDYDFWREPTW